jgi:hypothetical protein
MQASCSTPGQAEEGDPACRGCGGGRQKRARLRGDLARDRVLNRSRRGRRDEVVQPGQVGVADGHAHP